MREIIRAEAWAGFRELVMEFGGDPDELLAAARVEPAKLLEPDQYLPLKALLDTLEISAKRLGRPDFGLQWGLRQDLSLFGPLSIAILNAPTARESIEIAGRYVHLHSPASVIAMAPVPKSKDDFISMSLESKRLPKSAQHAERATATLHKALRQLCGPRYQPNRIWFAHAPLSPPSVYRKAFRIMPEFGKRQAGIALDRKLLDAVQPGRSAQMRHVANLFLTSLGQARDDSFTTRVTSMVRGMQRGSDCSAGQIAMALGIHERTLQRRLKAESATFDAIKDGVRRELAEELLVQPGISFTQIALMIGYAGQSAFTRSCRRWFNASPMEVRKRLAAGAVLTPFNVRA